MKKWIILTDCVVRNEEIHAIDIEHETISGFERHTAFARDADNNCIDIVAQATSEEELKEKLEKILN